MRNRIPTFFISFAATEMTNSGFTGPTLVEITPACAADFEIDVGG
ncbi:hypothetical protein [Undibacterium sp. Xuan67W]